MRCYPKVSLRRSARHSASCRMCEQIICAGTFQRLFQRSQMWEQARISAQVRRRALPATVQPLRQAAQEQRAILQRMWAPRAAWRQAQARPTPAQPAEPADDSEAYRKTQQRWEGPLPAVSMPGETGGARTTEALDRAPGSGPAKAAAHQAQPAPSHQREHRAQGGQKRAKSLQPAMAQQLKLERRLSCAAVQQPGVAQPHNAMQGNEPGPAGVAARVAAGSA